MLKHPGTVTVLYRRPGGGFLPVSYTHLDVYKRQEQRSYYALNVAVTAENYEDFLDSTVVYAPVSNQLDAETHPTKNVWLNIYNAADNFLSATYQPLLQNYDCLLYTSRCV